MWRTPGIPALRAIPTQSRIPEILAKTVPPPRHKKTPPHSFQLSPGNLRSGEKASGFPGRRRPGRSNGMRYTGAEPRILPLPGQPRTDHQRTCPSSWRAPAAPDWAPGWGGGHQRKRVRRRKLDTKEPDHTRHSAKCSHWERMEVHLEETKYLLLTIALNGTDHQTHHSLQHRGKPVSTGENRSKGQRLGC